jgi:hypothetical protein
VKIDCKKGDILHVIEDVYDEGGDIYFKKGQVLVIEDDWTDESHYKEDEVWDENECMYSVLIENDSNGLYTDDYSGSYEVYLDDLKTGKIISKRQIREKGLQSLLD